MNAVAEKKHWGIYYSKLSASIHYNVHTLAAVPAK